MSVWVSVDPLDEDRDRASEWCVHLKRDGDEIGHVDAESRARGWAALVELDDVIVRAGFSRIGEWQLGSGLGYVALIEPAIEVAR